ncbi:MAG: vWA domain-containing protein [Blastocatellia bacterium]
MKRWMTGVMLGIGFAMLCGFGAATQNAERKCQVILLDVSGSMKKRYENNLRDWLVRQLVSASVFSPRDQLLIRWFARDSQVAFDPHDPRRRFHGSFGVAKAVEHVPEPDQVKGQTDLPQAIEQVLADLDGLRVNDDVLIWMVTDNEQSVGGHGSADPFYQQISGNQRFRSAYLFPLLKENGEPIPADRSAMVLYLLHYSPGQRSLGLDRVADDVGSKIANRPVTWFPIENGITFDDRSLTVGGEPAHWVDNIVELPEVAEGASPQFTLQFRFKSQLRGREISDGKIERPQFTLLSTPDQLRRQSESAGMWPAPITPTRLAINPGESSSTKYSVTLSAGDLRFEPDSFWDAVWHDTSEPVKGGLRFNLSGVTTQMESKLLEPVKDLKNLSAIRSQVQQSDNSGRPVVIPVFFRVRYNTLWRRVAAGLLGLALLGGLAAAITLVFARRRYELLTPEKRLVIGLSFFSRHYITREGERAAMIRRQFGRMTIAPQSRFSLDGKHRGRRLREMGDRFVLVDTREGGLRYEYSLRPINSVQKKRPNRDSLLDG